MRKINIISIILILALIAGQALFLGEAAADKNSGKRGGGCDFCHAGHLSKGQKPDEGLLKFKVAPAEGEKGKDKGRTSPTARRQASVAAAGTANNLICLDCHWQAPKSSLKASIRTLPAELSGLVTYSAAKHKVHQRISDQACQTCHKDHKPLPPIKVEVKVTGEDIQLSWSHAYNWYKAYGYKPASAAPLKTAAKTVGAGGPARPGYNIYRSTIPNGGFKKINPSLVETNYFEDAEAEPGKSYYYVVTTVFTPQEESKHSAAAHLAPSALAAGRLTPGTPTLTVKLSPENLEADGRDRARVVATLKGRWGRRGAGQELEFLLASAGDVRWDEDAGRLEVKSLRPDSRGMVEADFMAGTVPKSVLVIVKEPRAGLKATGVLRQWIELETSLTLEGEGEEPLRKGGLLEVKVTPAVLPADGVSTARIEVLVNERVGRGALREGVPRLILWQGGGTLKTLEDYRAGRLVALYTAPTKPGRAVIAVKYGAVNKYVNINIKANRAADSSLAVKPETLPADARSKAEVVVTVKDEAGRGLAEAQVQLSVVSGGGNIVGKSKELTDSLGQARFQYRAGHRPGEVVLRAKITSKIPDREDWQESRFSKEGSGFSPAEPKKPQNVAPQHKNFPFQSPTMDRPVDRKQDFIFK